MQAIGRTSKIGFLRLLGQLFSSPQISRLKAFSTVAPIALGIPAALCMPLTNLAKNPEAVVKPSDENRQAWLGAIYPLCFFGTMLNNVLLALLDASPTKLLSYLPFLPLAFKHASNEFKLMGIARKIRAAERELQACQDQSSHTLLERDLAGLYADGKKIDAQLSFFGRILFTLLLIPTFVATMARLSGRASFAGKNCLTESVRGSNVAEHLTGYGKLFMVNLEKEMLCLRESARQFLNPAKWGQLHKQHQSMVRAEISSGGLKGIGAFVASLGGGMIPIGTNFFNMILRLLGGASSYLAYRRFGDSYLNRNTPYDDEASKAKRAEAPAGDQLLDKLSNTTVSLSRLLSGCSNVSAGLNPTFATNYGSLAVGGNLFGGGLYCLSFLPTILGLTGLENTLQISASSLIFAANGAQNLHKDLESEFVARRSLGKL